MDSEKKFCCGQHRATKFCGDCGKKLYVHPLEGLLHHLKAQVATYERMLERWDGVDLNDAGGEAATGKTAYATKRVAKLQNLLVKWRGWCTEVEQCLGKK